ncbi:Gfo/Idh/MocA family oxidoreductase [bacterium]|nr:Gfo/Idh/MocA family oxidoreductase [candidate division CSSED10-310 bacterium]
MIKAGVVGVGHLGRHHARLYGVLPDVQLVGIADVDEKRGRERAEEYNAAFYTEYRELLGKVDVVSIAVPTTMHHRVTKEFLDAGIHVLLEKPIATSLLEADELVTLADDRGVMLQVGHLERFNPAVLAVKDKLKAPLFIEAHRIGPFSNRGTDVDVILDLMIHDLDLVLHFVKQPVAALHSVGVPVLSDQADIANCRIEFEGGCVANLTASRASLEPLRKMRIFQADSYISMDFQKRQSVMVARNRSVPFDFTNPMKSILPVPLDNREGEPLKLEIESFVACVAAGRQPEASGRAARDALALALEVRKALAPLPPEVTS